ncbi:MAG: metallophosphoesterase [Candidatus Brocadiia bacterium]
MSFLARVLTVWGGMHLYVFLRVWLYCGFGLKSAAAALPAVLLLMLAPIGGMWLERAGYGVLGRLVGIPGMVWAGAFFMFFSLSLVHDAWNLLLTAVGQVWPAAGRLRLTGWRPVAASAGLIAVLTLYGLGEAWAIRTRRVEVPTARLPANVDRLRVVQITDVHLGLSVGNWRLRKIARLVKRAEPDLIVSTGDLVDAQMAGLEEAGRMLAELEAPRGKFAIAGNHEYYAGLEQALRFTRDAGFRMLLNETAPAGEGLTLVGFEDRAARYAGGRPAWDEETILSQAPEDTFVLVLKHRPFVNRELLHLMDMQLSGHTHRGQIFPFSLAVVAYYEYPHGLVELDPGTWLYTSLGTGTWGPPMRVFNPPEVTVIDLVRQGGPPGNSGEQQDHQPPEA